MPVSVDATLRKVILDPRTPAKLRLEALRTMGRPSLRLLYKLTADRSPKVRFEAAKRLKLELARKELRNNERRTAAHDNQ